MNIKYVKNNLRNKVIADRKIFDDQTYKLASRIIYNQISNLVKNLAVDKKSIIVGIYWPLKGEPDLFKLILSMDYHFALPVIVRSDMIFTSYSFGDALEELNSSSLWQPVKRVSIIPNIIIAAGLMFDIHGYRLGCGKGHYDRYLAMVEPEFLPIKIGVCFHEYLAENLPYDENDCRFDYIVTEKIIIAM